MDQNRFLTIFSGKLQKSNLNQINPVWFDPLFSDDTEEGELAYQLQELIRESIIEAEQIEH